MMSISDSAPDCSSTPALSTCMRQSVQSARKPRPVPCTEMPLYMCVREYMPALNAPSMPKVRSTRNQSATRPKSTPQANAWQRYFAFCSCASGAAAMAAPFAACAASASAATRSRSQLRCMMSVPIPPTVYAENAVAASRPVTATLCRPLKTVAVAMATSQFYRRRVAVMRAARTTHNRAPSPAHGGS